MRSRSLRIRPLHDSTVSDYEVNECIEGLLKGDSVASIPNHLCQAVMTTMTQKRKDALLARDDSLANKYEVLLGQMKYGPNKFENDTTAPPFQMRDRSLRFSTSIDRQKSLKTTSSAIMKGAKLETIDIPTKQAIEPILKARRVKQVSKTNYVKSGQIDRAVDNIAEYELDSRRVAPRLLKVQELEQRLADAKARYEDARQRMRFKRQQYEQLEKAEQENLEHELKDQLLDFGSHVPTSLPLEYSKFSGKVLDMRTREYRSAQIRKYDDAAALRSEAVKREKQELDQLSERFTRSFKLQRQYLLKKQDERRESFKTLWKRKMEKNELDCHRTMMEARQAVENLERELAEAKKSCNSEIDRINNNERLVNTPIASRAAATPRRYY
ncbi:hypothetical protein M9Y10_027515 [Tritrichomonas musculus]|uniref:Uncharacterized protein n=1 Tax=Tritrichomonas musculus TaxID=1915356 RepID=A0ABR2GJF5_9EUKA